MISLLNLETDLQAELPVRVTVWHHLLESQLQLSFNYRLVSAGCVMTVDSRLSYYSQAPRKEWQHIPCRLRLVIVYGWHQMR